MWVVAWSRHPSVTSVGCECPVRDLPFRLPPGILRKARLVPCCALRNRRQMSARPYNVLLHPWARPGIDQWVRTFQDLGMQVERVMSRLGIVSGTIPEAALPQIE